MGPFFRYVSHGYACFTNDGVAQAYDREGNPCEFEAWEQPRLNPEYKWSDPADEQRTVAEIEEQIRKEYVELLQMGYRDKSKSNWPEEYRNLMVDKVMHIDNLIRDRRHKMNQTWVHSRENALRIKRVNDLLMKAVAKCIRLGKKTAQSLQWMEKVSNTSYYDVEACVYPVWENESSQLDYVPKEKSRREEQDRLCEQEDVEAPTHIWNIIANLGDSYPCKVDQKALAFHHSSDEYEAKDWNFKNLVMDDGQSWDEGIHFPAYQDVYFTYPFHCLFLDNYDYSFEDLCCINDFRVVVNVRLETREQDRTAK